MASDNDDNKDGYVKTDAGGYVEIEVDEAVLEDHIRRYREFAVRVITWNNQPQPSSTDALELLGEHAHLLEEIGVPNLTLQLFHEAASALPLQENGGYSAAGILAATAEFLLQMGRSLPGRRAGIRSGGDLKRMSEGGASQLAAEVPRAKVPFGDIEANSVRLLVLQADYLAGRDGGSWTDKVPYAVDERTLQRWAAEVDPPEDRALARKIGEMAGLQHERDPDQRAFEEEITRYSMEELVRLLLDPPRAPGWRRR